MISYYSNIAIQSRNLEFGSVCTVGGFFRSKDLSGSAWYMYSPCADYYTYRRGPRRYS